MPNETLKRAFRASPHLAKRYNVDPRSILRWKKAGILPPADFAINGIDYWYEETIERNERENLARNRNATAA